MGGNEERGVEKEIEFAKVRKITGTLSLDNIFMPCAISLIACLLLLTKIEFNISGLDVQV